MTLGPHVRSITTLPPLPTIPLGTLLKQGSAIPPSFAPSRAWIHLAMIGLMTLSDLVHMLVARFRPLFSLLRAVTQLKWCLPLSFGIAHILPPFRHHHRRRYKRKALIIGITAPHAEGLVDGGSEAPSGPRGKRKGLHLDALSMAVFLHERYGYAQEDIKYLLDRPGFEYPTRENILKYINLLIQDAQEGDRFFFHYLGDSGQEDTNDCEQNDSMNECIITCQDEKILDDELMALLVKPLPHGSSLTAIFDTYHSGTVLDLPHYLCNRVYLPFMNKERRGTRTRWRIQARRRAILQGSKEATGKQSTEPAEPAGSSMSRVPILVERTIPGGSRAIPTLSVTTNFGNGKSTVLWDDSRICTSPIPLPRHCDGFGCVERDEPGEPGPDVICISSCGAAQGTWEGADVSSITTELLKILWENPHPMLAEVLSAISFRRYAAACVRRQQVVKFREVRQKNRASFDHINLEMVTFEIPQLSSLRPSALNRLWDP